MWELFIALNELSMPESNLIRTLSAMSPTYILAAGKSAALGPATEKFEGQVLE